MAVVVAVHYIHKEYYSDTGAFLRRGAGGGVWGREGGADFFFTALGRRTRKSRKLVGGVYVCTVCL